MLTLREIEVYWDSTLKLMALGAVFLLAGSGIFDAVAVRERPFHQLP